MLHYTVTPRWACDSLATLGEPGNGLEARDVNFACRIHPAAQCDIGEKQWVIVCEVL